MDNISFIIALMVWSGLVVLTVRIARNKGRNPVAWAIFAAIIPIVALIIVLLRPPLRPTSV